MQTAAHHSGVAIVAMPLCAVDRRALSQAWYDAMHLAEHRPPERPHAVAPPAARTFASRTAVGRGEDARVRPASLARSAVATNDARLRWEGLVERRALRPTLGRKIAVRLASLPPSSPKRLAFGAADGRVQIVVRGEGAQARIIAICTPAMRERVERALLEARYRLASHGVTAAATVRERVAC